ncbi:hypothetical protein [Erythrobacter sp. HL-111]|uniref:hypothetical protein n=1 Tax=Erythrobacter sp. HL-111 TaxID=1798193 RepID=UPI0006D9EA7F|nr:hypothetical protein [Erythrobacter sp. HL-111]KPP93196.1 MAG: Flagellar protein (FlbD) [Erythrobacteraceae bacterium HL-111]SDR92772.1 hypothetical protein SAMN04515621_0649 [Erythrobacter sp. HL-111]
MKFIKLESRGGNYLVVAENVAWLRTAENGQTSVGIVGGQPLLVVGSIEEVAEKILAAAGPDEPTAAAPAPAPPAAPVAAPAPAAALPHEAPPAPQPDPAPVVPVTPPPPAAPAPPRSASRGATKGTTLAERVAAAAAAAPRIKAGSQRMLKMHE